MTTRYHQHQSTSDFARLIFFWLNFFALLQAAWGYMNLFNTQHVNMYAFDLRFLLVCLNSNNQMITSMERSCWRNVCQQKRRSFLFYHASTQRLLSRRDIENADFDFENELFTENMDIDAISVKRAKLQDPYESTEYQLPNSLDGIGRYSANYENIYFKTTNSNRNFLKKRNEYRQKSNVDNIGNKNEKKNMNKYSWTRKTDRQGPYRVLIELGGI
jgi:hypothetical protein